MKYAKWETNTVRATGRVICARWAQIRVLTGESAGSAAVHWSAAFWSSCSMKSVTNYYAKEVMQAL